MRDLSSRLARVRFRWPSRGRRRTDERGAIGVLVAVFIAAGVLFGMGALVIDVGRLYQNRAELQNGADAGALVVARNCGQGNCPQTLPPAQAAAGPYANDNASPLTGGRANVTAVCGNDAGSATIKVGQGPCGSTPPATCPKTPAGGNYVDVQTSTGTPSTLLPPVFAGSLISGYNGTTVVACAQATWGFNDTLGFTICAGEVVKAQTNGQVVAPPPNTTVSSSDEVTLVLGNGNGNGSGNQACGGTPGDFGWVSTCPAIITGPTYSGNPGKSDAGACNPEITAAWNAGNSARVSSTTLSSTWQNAIVYLPLYSTATGSGRNTVFTLNAPPNPGPPYIGFVITSYSLPSGGSSSGDWLTGSNQTCKPNGCISGFFVNQQPPASKYGSRLIG